MIGISLCGLCAHNRHESRLTDAGLPTGACDAFPDGIPLDIFAGGFDHREQFADETVLFVRARGVTSDEVDDVAALAELFGE